MGYIDTKGNVVFDFIYEACSNFSEGFANVTLNGKMGFLNLKGEPITAFKCEESNTFAEGLAKV